ncbi:MAG TPA: hypothetical protein VH088_23335 [Terriglobales bacterium]|jgi:hypothetical protein|nr:hypothetical protein [Terriglobales bacterium]
MKTRTIAVALLMCFAGAIFCLAEDAMVGSWKLNEAKSKFSQGAPKTTSSMYEIDGDNMKVTLDGVGFDGKAMHTEWTGKFDGKDYPVTGDSHQTSRSYTRVNDHTVRTTVKNGDKVLLSATLTTSADGKTRTVKASGAGAEGKKYSYTAVYDKQ